MTNTVNLAERFANSDKFKTLFQDGMALVEESANYLDGIGRDHAKTLPRSAAMLYGAESMRLTTRLMQLASWLLLQRAANEGEMTREQIMEEKGKIKLGETVHKTEHEAWELLPGDFRDLVARSMVLQNRVMSLDAELYGTTDTEKKDGSANPVEQQINLLSTALGASKQG